MNYDSSKGPILREALRDGMRAEYLGDKGTIYVARTGSIDFIPDDREIPCRALLHRNYTQWDGIQLLLTPPSIEHGLMVGDVLKGKYGDRDSYIQVLGICGEVIFVTSCVSTYDHAKNLTAFANCYSRYDLIGMDYTLHLPTQEDPKEKEEFMEIKKEDIHVDLDVKVKPTIDDELIGAIIQHLEYKGYDVKKKTD